MMCDGMLAAGLVPPESRGPSLETLPLHLVASILGYVRDTGDLARLCCTCRLLNFMALPLLYKKVTLTSYDKIRFLDSHPEGCGSASPFSMGLNCIIARNVGPLVKALTLRGQWKEADLEEHGRLGRVPDASMMLNIAVRAALDKMTCLESFSWQLNTKALEPVFQGLAQLPKLKHLTIQFLSSRHPRPTVTIPPMPHLQSLKITDIDPLCYPDDISFLLAKSRNLSDLRMHWSPRMKKNQEASVRLLDYFHKCVSTNSPLKLKKVSFQNIYALYSDEVQKAIENSGLEEVHVLDSPSIFDDDYFGISFVDTSWSMPPCIAPRNLKTFRHDSVNHKTIELLTDKTKLENLYYVTPIRNQEDHINRVREPESSAPNPYQELYSDTPIEGSSPSNAANHDHGSAGKVSLPFAMRGQTKLRNQYLDAIYTIHGPRLKRLLLPSRWPLSRSMLAQVVKACPNLEQFACAPQSATVEVCYAFVPYLRNAVALRLLVPTAKRYSVPSSGQDSPLQTPRAKAGRPTPVLDTGATQDPNLDCRASLELVNLEDRVRELILEVSLADDSICGKLKVFSIGWKAWEVGSAYKAPAHEATLEHLAQQLSADSTSSKPNGADSDGHDDPWTAEMHDLVNSSPFEVSMKTRDSLGKRKHAESYPPSPRRSNKKRASATEVETARKPQPPEINGVMGTLTPPAQPLDEAQPENGTTPAFDADAFIESFRPSMCESAWREVHRSLTNLKPIKASDGMVWKRRVRRVGWDVVKDYEIFNLDTQEI